ncbi:multicopper oxidase family protein [Yangia mangrovi]|uniref:Copper oxidase n=1 Tax=Alloyangia mangrovi TaxID=1779329 RepID=A0A2A3JYF2_9RHOB|nr:multicopper oxidase family protein [Alloyangia mangrovi]MCT4371295.1 multicopper oxidase family protein [Alloyangia mangrovi]
MTRYSRRGFLAASAAVSGSLLLPARARAASDRFSLTASTRTIEVNGRAATVMGLTNGAGGQGLTLDPGQRFAVDLANGLDVETIIHWHGQIPPNALDGAPNTNPMLKVGERRAYDFTPRTGTFWMHSHIPQQEIAMLAAPLIVRSPEEIAADRQEVVMFLHDFSFKSPEEVLAETSGSTGGHHGEAHAPAPMDHGAMHHGEAKAPTGGMSGMGKMQGMAGMGSMSGMPMDLNDFDFDAYLANDRTLDDPEVVTVERNGRIRMRIINGSSMTAYWIDTVGLQARLVAVDGDAVEPLTGTRFPIASGQRMEIDLDMPGDGVARPVLALREGAHEQTGLILAPEGAAVPRLPTRAETETPPVAGDMRQELALRAASPLAVREPDVRQMVMLGGTMNPYVWTINGAVWEDHMPIAVPQGARVEMMFHNMSMMAHPMHLHGHVFQVVAIGDQPVQGALRDTVFVPAMGSVTVAFDAGEAARWMMHCHHMGHLAKGMMTELQVRATA